MVNFSLELKKDIFFFYSPYHLCWECYVIVSYLLELDQWSFCIFYHWWEKVSLVKEILFFLMILGPYLNQFSLSPLNLISFLLICACLMSLRSSEMVWLRDTIDSWSILLISHETSKHFPVIAGLCLVLKKLNS